MVKPTRTQATPDIGTSAVTAAMMTLNPVTAQAWVSFISESTRFLTERLQQDMDAQKAMMACKSPTELLQVQAAFLQTAMDQYTDYASRLQKTMTTVTATTIKDVQSGPSRGYDDVPI